MTKHIQEHIRTTILARIEEQNQERRTEALAEFMSVTGVVTKAEPPQSLMEMVPPIEQKLYEKWIEMFTQRLLETAPINAIELLCDGQEENNAALVLAYLMFLESERMEKQIDKDLAAYGRDMTGSDDMADAASSYIRARLANLANKTSH